MGNVTVRNITLAALAIALTTLATLLIRIPNPATQGYINLGDAMLFTVALVFGWRIGGLAGGVGSALADALGGYFLWAPWTLVIKGMEGILVGRVAAWGGRDGTRSRKFTAVAAVLAGGAWMVSGYYLAGSVLFGGVAALTEIPGNLVQAGVAVVVALPLSAILKNALQRSEYGPHASR